MKKARAPDAVQYKILQTALKDVPFDGWTDEVLIRAARACRLSEDAAHAAFPKGALDLVLFFSAWADQAMLEKLPARKLENMRVRDKVALCVQARLDILEPHREAVSRALSFLAPPPRNIHLPKRVWATADKIWRACGDTATDYNHYTKRLLLSGVLAATTLYWLNDESAGREKTKEFLARRIDDVLKLGAVVGKLKKKR